jgi:hypothetical protein
MAATNSSGGELKVCRAAMGEHVANAVADFHEVGMLR